MPRIPLKYPPKGTDPTADAIRQRRGPRGLSALDGTLLNASEVASGWNTYVGGVRSRNSLPGDIRELIILRVAARNYAAFEWTHHEHVGRDDGLTTEQLAVIRDLVLPMPSVEAPGVLSPLQAAALAFADASTVQVRVPDRVFENLKKQLAENCAGNSSVDQQLLECTATAGTYNMVSRLLVALDVEDHAHDTVGLPGIPFEEHTVNTDDGVSLAVRTGIKEDEPGRPVLLFVNSLMTDLSMWDIVISTLSRKYNIVTFDQRGHGKSSVPKEAATIDRLSDDISQIVKILKLPVPLHAIIGVSQGGATTLNVSTKYPNLATRFVVCDTQAKSPPTSAGAWDERIQLARTEGMEKLADVTVDRWFPRPSEFSEPGSGRGFGHVHDMILHTPLEGFIAGARALQSYEVPIDKLAGVFKDKSHKLLLIAGEKDGKLPEVAAKLKDDLGSDAAVQVSIIPGSGHLPMLHNPAAWTQAVSDFLA